MSRSTPAKERQNLDYAEEFTHPAQDFPLYQKLLDKLGEEGYRLADEVFTTSLVVGLETESLVDFDLHRDDSFDGFELDNAFLPETIVGMPRLVFELQFSDAGLLKGITEGMYAYSGLDIFAFKWLSVV